MRAVDRVDGVVDGIAKCNEETGGVWPAPGIAAAGKLVSAFEAWRFQSRTLGLARGALARGAADDAGPRPRARTTGTATVTSRERLPMTAPPSVVMAYGP